MELLTVMAIIAMLIAILVPSVLGALQFAKAARCGANLREISKAIANLRSDEPRTRLHAASYQTTLLPYVENERDVFVCNEYAADSEESSELALTSLVYCRVTQTGANGQRWDVELTENAYVIKISDTVYQEARSEGKFQAGYTGIQSGDWPYAPDDTPNVYWLCIEDHGNDWDFKDIMIMVTENGADENGISTITLTLNSGPHGHRNFLVSKVGDFSPIEIPGGTYGTNLNVTVPINENSTSYGMHTNPEALRYDGTKAILMDYDWVVARPTDVWDYSAGLPPFVRHTGKMNVLFGGGEVIRMRPEEIDPADPIIQNTYWHYERTVVW